MNIIIVMDIPVVKCKIRLGNEGGGEDDKDSGIILTVPGILYCRAIATACYLISDLAKPGAALQTLKNYPLKSVFEMLINNKSF